MKNKYAAPLTSLFLILTTAPSAWAWGPAGHKTVGNIAEKLLSTATKQTLAQYLKQESLADVSNWPDTLKDKPQVWGHTFSYHFESVPDNETYLQSLRGKTVAEKKKGGIVAAILEAKRVFKDSRSKILQKTQAIKYLVHFVGDLHQPFHSGRPDDRGGNMVERKWHGKSTNLHAIWDTAILEDAYGKKTSIPDFSFASQNQKDKYTTKVDDVDYANYLIKKHQGKPLPSGSDDINQWIQESLAARSDGYEFKDESESDYVSLFVDVVDDRIYHAGVRLASILSKLTRIESESQLELGFRSSIEQILGPLSRVINLNAKNQREVADLDLDLENPGTEGLENFLQ